MANRDFQRDLYSLKKGLVLLAPVVAVGVAGAVTLKRRVFNQPGSVGVQASTSLVDATTSGAVGNPYSVGDAAGTRSVARTDTGDWTITLSDPYTYLVGVWILGQVLAAPGSLAVLSVATIDSSNVATNTAPGNGGVILITLNDQTPDAADPADGTILTLGILLGNASEP